MGLGAISLRTVGVRARPLVLGAVCQYRPWVRLALEAALCGLLRMGRQLQPGLSRRILRRLLGRIPRRAVRMVGLVPAVAALSVLRAEKQRAPHDRSAVELSRAGGYEGDGRGQVRQRTRGGYPGCVERPCASARRNDGAF